MAFDTGDGITAWLLCKGVHVFLVFGRYRVFYRFKHCRLVSLSSCMTLIFASVKETVNFILISSCSWTRVASQEDFLSSGVMSFEIHFLDTLAARCRRGSRSDPHSRVWVDRSFPNGQHQHTYGQSLELHLGFRWTEPSTLFPVLLPFLLNLDLHQLQRSPCALAYSRLTVHC